ncbi:helix-turn-helix domain-containing protein, partial [Candidatus Azambacteria bacterium]|nr:helix-turn-helix domain-containing protein [Candidatus Azambacteria bacterium]
MKKTTTRRRLGKNPITLRERSIIEVRWRKDGKTITEIAHEIGRNKSSVSREVDGR